MKAKLILKIAITIIGLGNFLTSISVFSVRRLNLETHTFYDGLGRMLYEPPVWIKLFFGINQWAGSGWHLFDLFWFWGSIFLMYKLHKWGEDSDDPLPQVLKNSHENPKSLPISNKLQEKKYKENDLASLTGYPLDMDRDLTEQLVEMEEYQETMENVKKIWAKREA